MLNKPSKAAIGTPVILVLFLFEKLGASFSGSLTASLFVSGSFAYLG